MVTAVELQALINITNHDRVFNTLLRAFSQQFLMIHALACTVTGIADQSQELPTYVRQLGKNVLTDPLINKGTAFMWSERERYAAYFCMYVTPSACLKLANIACRQQCGVLLQLHSLDRRAACPCL
jgi:hypothetical protein